MAEFRKKLSVDPDTVRISPNITTEDLKDYTKPISEDVIRLQEKVESIEKRLTMFMWIIGILVTVLVAVIPWLKK